MNLKPLRQKSAGIFRPAGTAQRLTPACRNTAPGTIPGAAFSPLPGRMARLPSGIFRGLSGPARLQTNACLMRENGVEIPGYTQCTHRQRPGFPRGDVAPG